MSKGLREAARTAKKFDYIIVGAGSAGCVVARRLADARHKVLLVEAGTDDRSSVHSWKVQMPSALAFNLADERYNWDYYTQPQPGLNGRKLHQPRGKTLGGSSAINAMAYVRGHAEDYERWDRELKTEGFWSYENVLPYFKRSTCHSEGESSYRGGSGPVKVSKKETAATHELNQTFVKAGVQAGYGTTEDPNGYRQEGFGHMDMTVDWETGRRSSTANCYLRNPGMTDWTESVKNGDLTIRTTCHVKRLLFDDAGASNGEQVVKGIELTDDSVLLAESEVILCAGAVGSTQILQLSGIGNADELQDVGIESKVHLPNVGENLQDHLEFYLQYLCKRPVSLYPYASTFEFSRYAFRQPWHAAAAGLEWLTRGTGVCASNHFEVGGFIRTKKEVPHPDVQFHFIPGCVVGQLDFLPQHGYQAHVGTMRPTSRGTIKITSKDPKAAPMITPNFLTTEKDKEDQRNAFRLGVEIMEQSAFTQEHKQDVYNFKHVNIDKDEEVDEWIRNESHSGYHLSCTNAMGKVVDPISAKVFGTQGLRVIDASVMPSMTSGNLNAPTIMLAEKLSDSILGRKMAPATGIAWYKPDARLQRSSD